MDKSIIIPLNLFKLDQEILITDQDTCRTFAYVGFAELPEVVVETSRAYDIHDVKLIGNGNYAEAISNEIKEYLTTNYSDNILNISIMEA